MFTYNALQTNKRFSEKLFPVSSRKPQLLKILKINWLESVSIRRPTCENVYFGARRTCYCQWKEENTRMWSPPLKRTLTTKAGVTESKFIMVMRLITQAIQMFQRNNWNIRWRFKKLNGKKKIKKPKHFKKEIKWWNQETEVLEMVKYLYKLFFSPNCLLLVFFMPVKVKCKYSSHCPKGFPISLN